MLTETHAQIGRGLFDEALIVVQKVLVRQVSLAAALTMQAYICLQLKEYPMAASYLAPS